MMFETFILFSLALFVLFIHPPGPGQILFMSHAAKRGLVGALPSAFGQLIAYAIQIAVVFSLLFGTMTLTPSAVWIMKILGIFYLAWFGFRLVTGRSNNAALRSNYQPRNMFVDAFVLALCNPATVLLVTALMMQFFDPANINPIMLVIFGGIYLLLELVFMLIFGALAVGALRFVEPGVSDRAPKLAGAIMIISSLFLIYDQSEEIFEGVRK